MKKATDLGLRVIEYNDYVLLTRGSEITLDDSDSSGMRYAIEASDLVASSIAIEETPLLVIEDEVDKVFQDIIDSETAQEFEQELLGVTKHGFRWGYKASQKSHPYSEEDLRSAISLGRSQGYEYASTETYQDSENLENLNSEHLGDIERFIQSLNKKELWIETEEDGMKSIGFITIPKIEDGKLKAMWK